MRSLLHGVTADEQADWLRAPYCYYSFTDAALLLHAVNSLQILRGGCTTVSQEYWALPGCFTGNEGVFSELLLFGKHIIDTVSTLEMRSVVVWAVWREEAEDGC